MTNWVTRAGVILPLVTSCSPPALVPSSAEPKAPLYTLNVRLLPSERTMLVDGTISIPGTDSARQELRLRLGRTMGDLQVQIVEPSSSAGPLVLDTIIRPGARVVGERSRATWVFRLRQQIPAGQPARIRFSLKASGGTGLLYYVGPELAFASGWGDPWYPVVEGFGGASSGELVVQAPSDWKVVTCPRHSQDNFTFAAGPYTVVRRGGTVPISAWLLTPRSHIDTWLGGAASMLNVLSASFGPIHPDTLSLVEVPRAIAIEAGFNAFSPAGCIVLNSRAFDAPEVTYLLEWLGHEMSHQWFPHALTWDPPGFQYLEEALAEYGGHRIVEELGGNDAARQLRLTGYQYDPIYSAAAYFRLVGAGVDKPLATMGNGIDQRNLAYNKGALMFRMLAQEMGRPVFDRMMQSLTRGPGQRTITWNEFRQEVGHAAGRDLDWFFDQWLARAGAPDFTLTWSQRKGSVVGVISQISPYYRARLTIEARGSAGQRARREVVITGGRASFDFPIGFTARDVVLDPDYEVLRWTPAMRAVADSATRSGVRPADPPE